MALINSVGTIDVQPGLILQVRIGVATGLVVVGELIGEGGAQERVAVGETLNSCRKDSSGGVPQFSGYRGFNSPSGGRRV